MFWRYVVIDRTSVEKHLYVAMRLELCSLLTFSRESRFVALPTKTILNKRFQADKTITRARYRLSDRIFADNFIISATVSNECQKKNCFHSTPDFTATIMESSMLAGISPEIPLVEFRGPLSTSTCS